MSYSAGYDLVQHLGDRIKTRFAYVTFNCNYSNVRLQHTVGVLCESVMKPAFKIQGQPDGCDSHT